MTDECCDIPAPALTKIFKPDEIIIYGVKLNNEANDAKMSAGDPFLLRLNLYSTTQGRDLDKSEFSVVVSYGYGYEGHCYRFDRTRIFILTGPVPEQASGCGFGNGFQMWRISASDQVLELATTLDDAKTVILGSNLPGRKSPNTYSANMALAHRAGRLQND